jgi:cardiolipin synthase A/B
VCSSDLLNYEYNLECYDADLARKLDKIVAEKLNSALQVTLQEVDSRPLPARLRDGIARLATPYL